ncbi:MAG: class I SAM-dependent methyltransferase [Calditrichota bacterium]
MSVERTASSVGITGVISQFNVRARFLKQHAQVNRVLELGCGSGSNLVLLNQINPHLELHGVDLRDGGGLPEYIRFHKMDLDADPSLPYPDESFDLILLTHVLEHLRNPLSLAREINRILKCGGYLYVEAPNWVSLFIPSFSFQRRQHGPFNFFDDPTHLKPWSKHGIYSFISQYAGLQVVRVGTVRNWARLPLDPLIIILALLIRRRGWLVTSISNLTGWCVYGVGRKIVQANSN